MTLIRSGIKQIRVIDYDTVTLSSLNRHAFAFRSDVGKLKVRVVKEYAAKINPNIDVEGIEDAFDEGYAEKYILSGNPDYVIDCIDDLDAKCELLEFCEKKGLRVISSMGAGGKMDASCIRFSDFNSIKGEKLAKRLRILYKKKYGKVIPNFKSVYSIEVAKGLTDLEEHQKGNPEDYRINENERVRSLPVFASIPAIFGQALASVVLTDLAGMKILSLGKIDSNVAQVEIEKEKIGNVLISKLVEDFKKDEQKKNNMYLILNKILN
jgi:tRNA A37 threonylcarbamoyladenosine dehydratase